MSQLQYNTFDKEQDQNQDPNFFGSRGNGSDEISCFSNGVDVSNIRKRANRPLSFSRDEIYIPADKTVDTY